MSAQITPAEPSADPNGPSALPPALTRELIEALRSIRYGSIELTIHDGRCGQLERRHKVRFEPEVTQLRR